MELKKEAAKSNYYILSWYYSNGYVAEVYRADRHDEDKDETFELFDAETESGAVQLAYNWAVQQEIELAKIGQDYKTLHKDDDDTD